MKQINFNIFIVLGMILFLNACDSFSNVSGIEKVPEQGWNVLVRGTMNNPDGVPVPDVLAVKLTNFEENYEVIGTLNLASGETAVSGIIPGVYAISISGELTAGSDVFLFSGNALGVSIKENNQPVSIEISIAKSGAILIKEIFYAGSTNFGSPANTTFIDQYWEFYNNSGEVQYLDGLCFAALQPTIASATAVYPTYDPPYDNFDEWVFSVLIWKFPGAGTNYPLQPGESAIMAQWALNHQGPPTSLPYTLNLISCEFEGYTDRSLAAGLIDNPAHNMEYIFGTPASRWNPTVVGPAIALFKIPDGVTIDRDFKIQNNNLPAASKVDVHPIPVSWIIDAVETVGTAPLLQRKRIPAVLDAGGVTTNGSYNYMSLSRRVRETLPDGRIRLWDTNNSTHDFYPAHMAMIRRHNPGIPAWNTWYTLDPEYNKWFPKWVEWVPE